jgi:unsaturated rhamnogalacturonyl hydrolase
MNRIGFAFIAAAAALTSFALRASAQTPAPPAPEPTAPLDTTIGTGKVVGLDYFYNHQVKNGAQFHYIWEDTALSGYSKFGDVFKQYGATLAKLEKAPTVDDLKHFSVYIIVNPSTVKTAAGGKPNYIQPADADAIASWVNDGGVLALFGNDKNTAELAHLSQLAQRFGITFNEDIRNLVPSARDRSPGTFAASLFSDHPIFKGLRMIYMKEICTLQVKDPAKAILTAPKQAGEEGTGDDIIMAESRYGKGLVFAVGDPWVYNEYIDVTAPNLPIDNRKAAINIAGYLLGAASPPMAK